MRNPYVKEFSQTFLKVIRNIYLQLYFEPDPQKKEYLESVIVNTIKWLFKYHLPNKKCVFKLYYEIRNHLWDIDLEFGTETADLFKTHVKTAIKTVDDELKNSEFDIFKIFLNGLIGL
jgi:hypothetical protein